MARRAIDQLKVASVARTTADAYRLMRLYKLPVQEIIKREKRKHRFMNGFRRAWKRLQKIW